MFTNRLMAAFFGDNWASIKRGVTLSAVTLGEERAGIWTEIWRAEFGSQRSVSVGEALTFAVSDLCPGEMACAILAACREGV